MCLEKELTTYIYSGVFIISSITCAGIMSPSPVVVTIIDIICRGGEPRSYGKSASLTPLSWTCNNPGITVNVIITFNKITTIDSIAKGMHTTFSMFSGGALLISPNKKNTLSNRSFHPTDSQIPRLI
jgi:hypothetical protein